MDFSSWPREQEQSFVVYEQRNSESSKKAFTISGVIAVLWFVGLVGIYVGVKPDIKDVTKNMNMSNLTKKSKYEPTKTDAPAAAPAAPAAAPSDKPAETK